MDNVIQFTPAQIIALATAIITISTAVGVIINLISKAREPEKKQKVLRTSNRPLPFCSNYCFFVRYAIIALTGRHF